MVEPALLDLLMQDRWPVGVLGLFIWGQIAKQRHAIITLAKQTDAVKAADVRADLAPFLGDD